ncbi:MAG: 3'-5' exonuclease [Chloroflexota bacterium]
MLNWEDYADLPLANVPLAFVDVETTGLRADRGDRICEVGIAVFRGGEEVQLFSTLVNPLRPISRGAAAVNGLSDAEVQTAPPFSVVAVRVAEALSQGLPVAHNASFDLSFLTRELAAAGVPPPAPGSLDTLAIAHRLFPFERCGLGELVRAFAVPPTGQAHRALADALTTHQVMDRMLALKWPNHGPKLSEVVALQRGLVPWAVPATATATATQQALPPHLADLVQPGRLLEITYLGTRGERTRRIVEAREVYASGETLYLDAFCHLRQEQRTFRLDRILLCEPATQP